MAVTHHLTIEVKTPQSVSLITNPSTLREALSHPQTVILDNPGLDRWFDRLLLWRERREHWRFLKLIAVLIALLVALAISLNYGVEVSVLADWKIHRVQGKLTLTPLADWREGDAIGVTRAVARGVSEVCASYSTQKIFPQSKFSCCARSQSDSTVTTP